MKLLILILFLFPLLALGNTEENIKDKIDQLLHLKPEEYSKVIEEYRKGFESYFGKRKAICLGEFSSNILEADEAPLNNKLTKVEKRLCLDKMKKMQTEYINSIFLARKRYLEYLHKKRVQNLIEAKALALKDINAY